MSATAFPVGAYITDRERLLYVLESDAAGVLCEDAASALLVELHAKQLDRWRLVIPEAEAS